MNAADGFHLWSHAYDRELTGVFAAQDEIARAVVDALKLRLVPASRRHEPTPEAYNEYLLGNTLFRGLNYENFVRSVVAYQRAVTLDPDYARAWAALAMARFWVADGSESVAAISKGFDEAMSYAEKSLTLDPELGDGYTARGFLRGSTRTDWEGSRADFERALNLNPGAARPRARHAGTAPARRADRAPRPRRCVPDRRDVCVVRASRQGVRVDRAYVQRDAGLRAVKFSPLLRGLRGDPRYRAMLAKMNLPPD